MTHWLWKAVLAELYADFVPRFLKKPMSDVRVNDFEMVIRIFSAMFKFPIGIVILVVAADFKNPILGNVGTYLILDWVYQMVDIVNCAQKEILRQSATLIVDLLSYPFWYGWRRVLPQVPTRTNG